MARRPGTFHYTAETDGPAAMTHDASTQTTCVCMIVPTTNFPEHWTRTKVTFKPREYTTMIYFCIVGGDMLCYHNSTLEPRWFCGGQGTSTCGKYEVNATLVAVAWDVW